MVRKLTDISSVIIFWPLFRNASACLPTLHSSSCWSEEKLLTSIIKPPKSTQSPTNFCGFREGLWMEIFFSKELFFHLPLIYEPIASQKGILNWPVKSVYFNTLFTSISCYRLQAIRFSNNIEMVGLTSERVFPIFWPYTSFNYHFLLSHIPQMLQNQVKSHF